MSTVETWMQEYRTQASSLVGAGIPWLDTLRERAIDRFCADGWPTSKQEGWRHTSLALLQQQNFAASHTDYNADLVKTLLAGLRNDHSGHWLVFVDGRFIEGLSEIGTLPDGAHIMPVS